jgi:hypothetical protein
MVVIFYLGIFFTPNNVLYMHVSFPFSYKIWPASVSLYYSLGIILPEYENHHLQRIMDHRQRYKFQDILHILFHFTSSCLSSDTNSKSFANRALPKLELEEPFLIRAWKPGLGLTITNATTNSLPALFAFAITHYHKSNYTSTLFPGDRHCSAIHQPRHSLHIQSFTVRMTASFLLMGACRY